MDINHEAIFTSITKRVRELIPTAFLGFDSRAEQDMLQMWVPERTCRLFPECCKQETKELFQIIHGFNVVNMNTCKIHSSKRLAFVSPFLFARVQPWDRIGTSGVQSASASAARWGEHCHCAREEFNLSIPNDHSLPWVATGAGFALGIRDWDPPTPPTLHFE